jgi:putative two-component system response regulator
MILHGDCGQFNPLLLECLVEIQDVLKAEIVGRGNESVLAAAETSAEGSRPLPTMPR